MDVTMQSLTLTVGDLERSIEFYTGLLGFPLVAQRQQVAILQINQAYRSQVLVLRESQGARHPGGGTIGVKVLGFEVALLEELDQFEKRLAERHASVRRLRRDSYETVIGADPDNYAIAISASSTGRPTQMAEWSDPDEIIEALAQ
jgi:catechol 2,3-dioxygenase-like lactoylglutathione lyase family enzyme